jgi:hypothetical protein
MSENLQPEQDPVSQAEYIFNMMLFNPVEEFSIEQYSGGLDNLSALYLDSIDSTAIAGQEKVPHFYEMYRRLASFTDSAITAATHKGASPEEIEKLKQRKNTYELHRDSFSPQAGAIGIPAGRVSPNMPNPASMSHAKGEGTDIPKDTSTSTHTSRRRKKSE